MSTVSLKKRLYRIYILMIRFMHGEHAGDALRNVAISILPSLAIYLLGAQASTAIGIGVGSLLTTLTDPPGNRKDKLSSALVCIPTFFVASLFTAIVFPYHWPLVIVLAAAGFICTLYGIFGARYAAIGNMTLILMSFVIGMAPQHPFAVGLQITTGSIIYYFFSLLQAYIQPYRSLKHAMANGFHGLSQFLLIRSQSYDPNIPLNITYSRVGKIHGQISEQQEQIRSLLFREKKIISQQWHKSNYWLSQVYGLIDLHELIIALDHDYDAIRKNLADTGSLPLIRHTIKLLALEIDSFSQPNKRFRYAHQLYHNNFKINALLRDLKEIQEQQADPAKGILCSIISNIEAIIDVLNRIQVAFYQNQEIQDKIDTSEYQQFISRPLRNLADLKSKLHLNNPLFRFAIRMALLFGTGALIGILFLDFKYTYWILLTIAIVARPAFSMTKTRNIERIVGTFSGIIVGVFCLISIHFLPALLTIAALGLFGFFLFNRSNYMVSVIFITLGIVIALNLFEGNINLILGSRILFTLIGAFLAIAGYFLIPVRQSTGMVQLAKEVSLYNAHYFQIINNRLSDERQSSFDIRLARKKAQTAMALFSDAINQMKKEPEHKWMDWSHIHHFQALAYQVNSHLVGLSLSLSKKTNRHLAYDIHSRIDALKPLLTDLNQTAERINLKKS
ncbi:hypothetical protein AAW12_15860 [Sphingobacterium sp. Ag1]|uniref:FUSC family protein n=1 Tax=Sphingobacterium sp. Ag1 TaxID=1643451 RepID=UPI0006276791|nr:FUSC family membrane protein [Sphingobacterium sp. Ag1]KKO90554.1 hypothetical protein AAW12_15860 [Sphingobacterium sp. Ag1]